MMTSNKQEMRRPLPPSLSTTMLMDFRGFSFEPQVSSPEVSSPRPERLDTKGLVQILESAIKLIEDDIFLLAEEQEATTNY
jgi:hypothetical protein